MENENMNVCKFCGQVLLNGRNCNCDEARKERRILERIKQACDTIEMMFTEDSDGEAIASDTMIKIMKSISEQVARAQLHSAQFVLTSGCKAKISRNATGVIKIEKTETKKESESIEE